MSIPHYKARTRIGLEAIANGKEVWFPHPNKKWRVSNLGNIYTLKRWVRNGGKGLGYRLIKSQPLLCGSAKGAARAVLETFVGICPTGMECCHNNGDDTNNRLDNLRWDTHAANMMDAVRHGTDRIVTMSFDEHSSTGKKAAKIVSERGTRYKFTKEDGRKGGTKSAKVRAAKYSHEELSEIARRREAAKSPELRAEIGRRLRAAKHTSIAVKSGLESVHKD